MSKTRTTMSALLSFVSCFLGGFLSPAPVWAACTGSSPHWATTADLTSVKNCVAQAAVGDTVTVRGNATWESTLELRRGIQLRGSENPTITGQRVLVRWVASPEAQAAHDTMTISGFTFDGANATAAQVGSAGLLVAANARGGHVTLIVKNNTIKNAVGSARGLYLQGQIYGVASTNVFDRVAIPLSCYGDDYYSWSTQKQAYGIAENFFFENNIIHFTSDMPGGHTGWISSGQGGRVVVRHNTWDLANVAKADEFWDIHGLQGPAGGVGATGCQNYSTMVAEYYGNKIVGQNGSYRWVAQRGGWLLMFYNTLAGTTRPYNGVTAYFCDTCQEAGSFSQNPENTYAWRNLANGAESPLTVYLTEPGCLADPVVENSDFFNYSSSFDGATGVGCGTLSERPATCTMGVGYWATDQSCSDFTGMVGARPAMSISGTLYKCTAPNTWTPYYSPYLFPHPLAGPSAPARVVIK